MAKTKYIETPEYLWELFKLYRDKVKNNPFTITDWVGAMAVDVERKKEKPLTLEGFENYCADADIISDLSQYFANTEGRYTDYQTICSRIRRTIKQDQIEGGMAGIYNPSITQRLNGLVEKSEQTVKQEQPFFQDVPKNDGG